MSGDPVNVRVWQTGDLYVWGGATFTPATDVPTDIDDDLVTTAGKWATVGLILGDPGIEMPREIDENDLSAWQIRRFRTVWRNGRLNGTATLLEDNEVVDELLNSDGTDIGIPMQVSKYLAMEFFDSDTGWKERRVTKAPAALFAENHTESEDPKGRPVRIRFYPDASSKIFTVQKAVAA